MKKLLPFIFCFLLLNGYAQNSALNWFQSHDFNMAEFKKPPLRFGPMARWWWPGNDVTKEELKREINLFADNGFAGVEVQPMNLAIPMNAEVRRRVISWDTPEYYDNLRTVMDEARKRNMIVDVTNGSGWPPGGPFLNPEDGFLSLEFAAVNIEGGKKLSLPLPRVQNNTTVTSLLQAVVASRVVNKNSVDTTDTVRLDPSSTLVLTTSVKNDTLSYTFPPGQWEVIAFWAIPSGEQTNIAATAKQGPVVDHFDSVKVLKLYNHLFGERTGLQSYFGNPMRAIFNDSYEFKANRHYSPDFITFFKKKRGYDITPYLPANMQRGYNFVSYLNPHAKPDFSFSDQDWRLRYDYDVTLGELLGEHFFKTSREWMEKRGLLHRTQAYGLNMDMIAMAGLASIPETESMLGPEADLKIMTSGALLYNKPLMTAESVVFINRAYTTTPQTIKLAVDKLFAAGVNQVIYHGVPYRYTPEKLGPEGWNPFSTPFIPGINFSSHLGEGNIFWKDQNDVNEYVSRVQYALRAGKPRADVLIYFPFLSVEGTPDNPEEIFTKGSLDEVPATSHKEDPKAKWAKSVYPLINRLEANGVAWSWVNDASLQEATLTKDSQINIRGNLFQALILANDSIIQLKTAQQIKSLSDKGMRLMATGVLPAKQPSYLNWKENDKRTAGLIQAALKAKNSRYLKDDDAAIEWMKTLNLPVKFTSPAPFTRQAQKQMRDGSRIHFIWNKTGEWQTLAFLLDKQYKSSYWLDADAGTVSKNNGSAITYRLAPYGSVILLASKTTDAANGVATTASVQVDVENRLLSIDRWNIKVDSVEINDSPLFNWKNNEQLKFSSAQGIYTSSFQWNEEKGSGKQYVLDLGKVSYTAEVYVNGTFAGNRIYSPYMLDITPFLKQGTNNLEIRITPGMLNGFIGLAKSGDKRYNQFKGKEDQLMSAGLIGPVVIRAGK